MGTIYFPSQSRRSGVPSIITKNAVDYMPFTIREGNFAWRNDPNTVFSALPYYHWYSRSYNTITPTANVWTDFPDLSGEDAFYSPADCPIDNRFIKNSETDTSISPQIVAGFYALLFNSGSFDASYGACRVYFPQFDTAINIADVDGGTADQTGAIDGLIFFVLTQSTELKMQIQVGAARATSGGLLTIVRLGDCPDDMAHQSLAPVADEISDTFANY